MAVWKVSWKTPRIQVTKYKAQAVVAAAAAGVVVAAGGTLSAGATLSKVRLRATPHLRSGAAA